MKRLDFIATPSAITGYSDSSLAKSETKDCVVRAIASSSGMTYDKAHTFVAEKFNRKFRKGTYSFTPIMNRIAASGERINRKSVKPIDVKVKTKTGVSKMTVARFAKRFTRGSYVVEVSRHAFTIKDGKVMGNYDDAIKTRRKVRSAWKIGTR